MIVLLLLDAALLFLEWFTQLFGDLPALALPAALSLVVPVPFIGSGATAGLTSWFAVAISVVVALVVGKGLQWIYSLIPYKAT